MYVAGVLTGLLLTTLVIVENSIVDDSNIFAWLVSTAKYVRRQNLEIRRIKAKFETTNFWLESKKS
jgi:hypothetical protein